MEGPRFFNGLILTLFLMVLIPIANGNCPAPDKIHYDEKTKAYSADGGWMSAGGSPIATFHGAVWLNRKILCYYNTVNGNQVTLTNKTKYNPPRGGLWFSKYQQFYGCPKRVPFKSGFPPDDCPFGQDTQSHE